MSQNKRSRNFNCSGSPKYNNLFRGHLFWNMPICNTNSMKYMDDMEFLLQYYHAFPSWPDLVKNAERKFPNYCTNFLNKTPMSPEIGGVNPLQFTIFMGIRNFYQYTVTTEFFRRHAGCSGSHSYPMCFAPCVLFTIGFVPRCNINLYYSHPRLQNSLCDLAQLWMPPLSNPPTDLQPRFHAIDYIDQVSSQNSMVNRRAISSVVEWRQDISVHRWWWFPIIPNMNWLVSPKSWWQNHPINGPKVNVSKPFTCWTGQKSMWDLRPGLANQFAQGHAEAAPRMGTCWTPFVVTEGQSAKDSATASDGRVTKCVMPPTARGQRLKR
jgi:hypothetical protein